METQITSEEKATHQEALKQLHLEFFKELQETGLGFHPELRGQITGDSIELGIIKPTQQNCYFAKDWASEVTIITEVNDYGRLPKIIFGSSGSFSPTNVAPYWRTKHAAIILDNWDLVQSICKRYCERYEKFFSQ